MVCPSTWCGSTAAIPGSSRGFDRVLVDAPCTGLGALRRRPEARWRRQPADVPALARLQRELLAAAIELTRPGGVVLYATCSPHLSETVGVVADALRRQPVTALDTRPLFAGSTISAMAPTCSSGRTGTAPTRCSRRAALGSRVSRPCHAQPMIAPSILAADFSRLADEIAAVHGRRLGARRRDGQPLRAEPDARPSGGGEPARGHRHPDGLPSDDRRPRPVGAALRRGRRLQRHVPRRGDRQPGRRRPRHPRRGRQGRACRSNRALRSSRTWRSCPSSTRC